MADFPVSWTNALVAGLIGQPQNVPIEVTVTYHNGVKIDFTGKGLQELWLDLAKGVVAVGHFESFMQAAAEHAEKGGGGVPSDQLREKMNLHQKPTPPTEE